MSVIKSFSVGDGDMFYINHNSDNFTTIDCCYSDDDNKETNFEEMKQLANKKGITRFISTHPDEDHIKGIEAFSEKVGIVNFYCVDNQAIKEDETDKYENAQWYKIYNNYKNESKILIANRDFLLCRDLTIITIMLMIIYFVLIGLKIIVFSKTIVVVMLIELIVSNISMRGKATRLAYNVISEDIYK